MELKKGKNSGNRIWIFIGLLVLFPIIQKVYDLFPADIEFPGYENGISFYFWMGKNIAFLLCLMAWRVSFKNWENDVFRYGWYLFVAYGIMEIFDTIPLEGEGMGAPLSIFYTIITSIVLLVLLPKALRYIRPSYAESLKEELDHERELNHYLELSRDQLKRKFKAMGQEEADKIIVGQAYLAKIFGQIERNKEMAEFGRRLYMHSGDIIEAAKSIQRKTLDVDDALSPEDYEVKQEIESLKSKKSKQKEKGIEVS